ncbi:MAG TPA: N-acetylneuraminate synthase [Burkholderiales bacterium]
MPAASVIRIAGRAVGAGEPCFVIAEAGVNHNGDAAIAADLIRAAAQAGADAVKFQTFSAERLATESSHKADYQLATTDPAESQFEMLKRLELPRAAYPELIALSKSQGILFLSSPFDEDSADFLEHLAVPAFKIPSGEITNLPLLEHVARKGRPMIVSTGMSDLGDVRSAVECIAGAGNPPLALLHCVSTYPAAPSDVNLRAMQTLRGAFATPVGYSDHGQGNEIALAAVALGACIVEKHLTISRGLPGPDHRASAEPGELLALVRGIRSVEAALGDGTKKPAASERSTAAAARRSLVAARDIPRGTVLTEAHIAVRRPGTGLPPGARPTLLGRRATRDIASGTLLSPEMFG